MKTTKEMNLFFERSIINDNSFQETKQQFSNFIKKRVRELCLANLLITEEYSSVLCGGTLDGFLVIFKHPTKKIVLKCLVNYETFDLSDETFNDLINKSNKTDLSIIIEFKKVINLYEEKENKISE